MTSLHWGRPDPFGVAEVAPFRDPDELLREMMDAVASLAGGGADVLFGEPPPLIAAFETRLRLSLPRPGTAPEPEGPGASFNAALGLPEPDDDDEDDDDAMAGATPGAASGAARDATGEAPLLARALRAWRLDLAGRWTLAICLGAELLPDLHEELAADATRSTLTVEGLANLLGTGGVEVTARVLRALQALERLELVELDGSGPWFQRGVRATEAALAIALAASASDLWVPGRWRSAAACDPRLFEVMHPDYVGPPLQLRGDTVAAITAIEDAATELGIPVLIGGPGRARSAGAALRDALAGALPVALCLDTAEEWNAAARLPWPACTLLVAHEPGASGDGSITGSGIGPGCAYQLLELP